MAITWSRLHEVLGIATPRNLTAEDIRRAVELNTPEDAALEFKGERRADEHAKDELGKDVAALANSGGGLIVFGVGEEGEGVQKRLVETPVELTDQAAQQIRATVWARVRPGIASIDIDQIPLPDDEGNGFLAINVAASPDAPHFYEKGNQPPAAPWRNGPHIENMREREIERAYRDRFSRRADAVSALGGLVDQVSRTLDFGQPRTQHWLVIASRPEGSVPLALGQPTRPDVTAALGDATRAERKLIRSDREVSIISQLEQNARRGLRRWVLRALSDHAAPLTTSVYAEVHHDGATALAIPVTAERTDADTDARPAIEAAWIEVAAAAAVALGATWQAARGINGGSSFFATVAQREPKHLWLMGRTINWAQQSCIPTTTRPVEALIPVQVALGAHEVRSQGETALELAEGVLHQFGYARIDYLKQGPE
ncbi:MAG: ATP-binding protein [Cellulomonas sp.]|nr:ATP-binding protein [Cellulomonas sp.]MCR6648527.1 ATP-binding protein [Cellulomonas sp.]